MKTEAGAGDKYRGARADEEGAHGGQRCPVDRSTATRLAQTFKALSDPTRVCIISVLAECELCVHELATALEMTHSAVSHQLATLREMRLVKSRKEGRRVFYSLDDEHIHDLFRQGLEHVQHE